jgi:SAM-dependent methyltransferase
MSQLVFDDSLSGQLDALYRTRDMQRRRRLVRAALGAGAGARILDVGCGPGFHVAELLDEVGADGSIVGVDRSPQMLAVAARRCQGHDNVQFLEADATSLPVEDAGFDRALSVQVLEYVADVDAALAELHRALRPGGRVVVWDVDWATVSWYSRDPARMRRVLRAWDEHLTHPSLPQTLAARLRSVGFADVHAEGHTFAATELSPDAYGTAIMPLIQDYVAGHDGITEEEATAWADEQRQLGRRGEFYFTCTQFCFSAIRAG